MNRDMAEKTMQVAMQSNFILDSYLNYLKENLEEKEFQAYCKKFGKIMGETLFQVLNPIWEEHPELKPVKMGGTYKTNDEHHKRIHQLIMNQANESGL
jgi:hypothetical protein